MTPREIALSICEPWFNGDPCEGCKCHKVCTKLVDRIAAAIQAVDSTVADHIVGANKKADHIPDATKMVATSQESRQVEPVAWRYIPSERLRDVVLTSDPSQARLAADYGCEVQPLYTAPPKREPLTDWEIEV